MLLAASPNKTKKKNVRRDFTATTKQNRFETLKIMKSDGEFMECPGLFYSVASHRPIFLAIIIMRYGNFTHRNIERSHLSLWGEKRKESHLIGFLPLVLIKTSIKQPKIAGEVEIDWIEIRLNKFSFTPRGGERKLFRWVSSFRCSISQRRSNFTDVTIHLQFQISFGRILCRGEGVSLICDLNSEADLRIETENKLFFLPLNVNIERLTQINKEKSCRSFFFATVSWSRKKCILIEFWWTHGWKPIWIDNFGSRGVGDRRRFLRLESCGKWKRRHDEFFSVAFIDF